MIEIDVGPKSFPEQSRVRYFMRKTAAEYLDKNQSSHLMANTELFLLPSHTIEDEDNLNIGGYSLVEIDITIKKTKSNGRFKLGEGKVFK